MISQLQIKNLNFMITTVTIRNIEDMSQKRVKIDELIQFETNFLHNNTYEDIPEI